MEIASPRWTAMNNLWIRYTVAFSSPVWYLNLLPNSFTNADDRGPETPDDSTTIGTNSCVLSRPTHFPSFRDSALTATAPAV